MVIAKSKIVEPEVKEPGTVVQDIWHKVDGTLNLKGKKLRDRVLEYLESKDVQNAAYSEIKMAVCEEYPDDYTWVGGAEKLDKITRTLVNNRDIKSVVGDLVKEDKAVDA
jgi:hypothetical protein